MPGTVSASPETTRALSAGPRLLGPLGRRAAAGSLAIALASIAILAGVMLAVLDVDLGNAGHDAARQYPTTAIISALRSAYLASGGWEGADFSYTITLANLEGVGLTVKAGDRVVLRVSPYPKQGSAASFPVKVGDRTVASALVDRQRSGLLPPEADLHRKLVDGMVISALIAALLAVSSALLASRRLVAPLHRLTVAVTRYGSGDRSSRAGEPKRTDEIGELAAAFNSMAARLEHEDYVRRALVADVAHEIRTPLAILRAQLDAFSMGIAEPTEEALGSLGEEVDRLSRFVDDLAVLAAAEAANLRLELEHLDLAEVAAAAAARLAARFAERGISLEQDLRPAGVLGDPGRLGQVAVNLLTNAEKFSPSGATVRLRVSSADGQSVMAVSDDGPGIPVEEQGRIFERFYRGPAAARERRTAGSGVGLAVVWEIVSAHGGTVEIGSAPGHGSTFVVRFPEEA